MRIGITGASGFIGSHLLRALNNLPGCTVTAFHRQNKTQPPGLEQLQSFVMDKDLIYHLAGVNRGTEEELIAGNILTTHRLVQAAQSLTNPPRLIFASSSQVYKPSPRAPLRETHAAEPASLYGVCKKAAEDLIRLSGLDYTLLRLANVYGPGCRPYYNSVIATFCDRAARKLPLFVNGDGRQGRDFIYIDDVVRAFLPGTNRQGKPLRNIFNISSGKVATLRQVMQNIKRNLPHSEVVFQKSGTADAPSYCCDNSRFMKQYGWKLRTSLRKGVENTLRWAQTKA